MLAVEWDRHAAATYAANWGEDHVIAGDIAAVEKRQIPLADLMIGGPPCQGFSNLGLKKLDDPRNQLWREYMRFIRTAKPQVFVIENVDRFSKSPEFQMLVDEVDHGILKNYEISYGVLNAADYGVSPATSPNHRHRVSSRQDRPPDPDARASPGARFGPAAVEDRSRRHRGAARIARTRPSCRNL